MDTCKYCNNKDNWPCQEQNSSNDLLWGEHGYFQVPHNDNNVWKQLAVVIADPDLELRVGGIFFTRQSFLFSAISFFTQNKGARSLSLICY